MKKKLYVCFHSLYKSRSYIQFIFQYSTNVLKYDRHGYKPRERIMLVTNKYFYLLEANKTIKQKHCLPLNAISFAVTQENDKVLMVRIPEELIKKDKVK